jgi:ComF family protein
MRFLEKLFKTFSAEVLPTECIVCGLFQKLSICEKCLDLLKVNGLMNYECCMQCGICLEVSELDEQRCTQCVINPPYFDQTFCLDRYDGVLQEGLHQLKYQKRLAFAHGLANAWNQIMDDQRPDQYARYLLPVPLSEEKLATRGFNQSWEIAQRICCGSHIKKSPYILRRHHYSEHQVGGSFTSRQHSVRGMFYIDPIYIKSIENRAVIVFDDVMTTGATLNEIARILKDNGVSHVINWVLLRTSRLN